MDMDSAKDIIYTPLDLPTPPKVDIPSFVDWMKHNKKVIYSNEIQVAKMGIKYPWLNVTVDMADKNNYLTNNLRKEFPEIYDYYFNFPVNPGSYIFTVQYATETVFPHSDHDKFFGLRYYLNFSEQDTGLYFMKTKERLEDVPDKFKEGKKLIEITDKVKIHPKQLPYPHAWFLNNIRALHGVDAKPGTFGDRISVIPSPSNGGYKMDEMLALLKRSTDKYKDYAIWY